MNLPAADREWLEEIGISEIPAPSNELGVPDRASDGRAVGPMSAGFWRRQIDPFAELLPDDELNAAALRCRSAYAAFLGARRSKGRKRSPQTPEAKAA